MPPSCALLGGFAIGARDALLWQHYGNAWQSPALIRLAQRTPHALRTHAPAIKLTWRLGVCDVICNEAVPFRPYCDGVATRTRNVSEYMLVLALCLVISVIIESEPACCELWRCYLRPMNTQMNILLLAVGQWDSTVQETKLTLLKPDHCCSTWQPPTMHADRNILRRDQQMILT